MARIRPSVSPTGSHQETGRPSEEVAREYGWVCLYRFGMNISDGSGTWYGSTPLDAYWFPFGKFELPWFECENVIDTSLILRVICSVYYPHYNQIEKRTNQELRVSKALSKLGVLDARHACTLTQHWGSLSCSPSVSGDPSSALTILMSSLLAKSKFRIKMVSLGSPLAELNSVLSDRLPVVDLFTIASMQSMRFRNTVPLHFSIARHTASKGSITGGTGGKSAGLE